ncbi:putative bifunctional diguanylate cyclase/phosphodiesterase [Sporosarcina siberiensis]|uniref:Bifunctional diguanylate cyclase/phosphodiesterase n=1 Tax=Sporosarcina siberiensis TaxID=1365606 RepID=A0ABW4SMY3_9BACL
MREDSKELQKTIQHDGTLSTEKMLADITYAIDQTSIVAITNRAGMILYVNDLFVEISKYPVEELVGSTHRVINSGVHSSGFFKDMWSTIGRGEIWRGDVCNKKKDGTYYWVDTKIVPFLNDQGKPYQYVSIRNDITELKESERMIHNLAYNDQLTNLPNRLSLRKKLVEELEHAEKNQMKIGYVRLNVDRFRYINDSLGFETGDYFLSVIGERLKEALMDSHIIGRISGDEFGIILRDIESTDDVMRIAKQLQLSIEKPVEVKGQVHALSISLGIALYPEHALKSFELPMKAEKALESAKEKGGGGIEIYQHGAATKTLERILLENDLRKSIQLNHFSLDYQPKVNLLSGEVTGLEALVRWDHPELGRISPDKFIPIAEETKLIVPLGNWVLREACKQAMKWYNKGFTGFRVAVNMSTIQLEEPFFIEKIQSILIETNVLPELLEIELTESVLANMNQVHTIIEEIRRQGIIVSLDDFGTGYSTFSYLKDFPVDTLKIDMTFIQDLHEKEESRAIVKTIISLANTIGLNVIAEGIELKEQAEILLDYGCQEGQGYYYSRPTTPEVCEAFMEKSRIIE